MTGFFKGKAEKQIIESLNFEEKNYEITNNKFICILLPSLVFTTASILRNMDLTNKNIFHRAASIFLK